MRRAWAGAVLLLAALALAGSADGGGEVSELERTPHFLVVRVSGPFDEVMLPPNTHVLGTPNREG